MKMLIRPARFEEFISADIFSWWRTVPATTTAFAAKKW
jgi:hypothetical protein